jgi:hypothetical protein
VKPGGHFICSVPVANESFVCFNAHRVFTRDYVLGFFPDFDIAEEMLLHPTPARMETLKDIHPFDLAVWCFDLKRRPDGVS